MGSPAPDDYYNVVVTQGQQYVQITKFGDIDTDPEIIQDDALYNVLGEDLAGTGTWSNTSCGTKERFYPPDYGLKFERDTPPGTEVVIRITNLTFGSSANYHTIVEVPAMQLDEGYTDYLLHYYTTPLNLYAEQISDCYMGCGGYLPTSVTFTLEIVEGQQYGSIYNIQTDQSGSYFTDIETDESWPGTSAIEDRFVFVADGVQPDTINVPLVTIRFTASDPDLGHVDYNYIIQYNETPPIEEGVIVSFEKPVLSPGDTTLINLKHIYDDGTVTDFPEWQSFEIGMLEGCEGGEILVGDSLGTYFDNVYQPIKFVAADSIETSSIEVKLRAGFTSNVSAGKIVSQDTIKNKEKYKPFKKKNIKESNAKGVAKVRSINKFNKKYTTQWQGISAAAANTESNFCFTGNFYSELLGDGDVVVEKENTILLGETKYYQVGLDANDELEIQEVKPGTDGVPHLNQGIPSNEIWGDDPVQIVSGDKLGVYWETDKPVWVGNTKNDNLEEGLIRLIGRYWREDIEYKVKLVAHNGSETISKEIKVVKPGKLLSAGQTDSYAKTKDVFDNIVNIDSLCIYYSGINGIPPQFIKGQIFQESDTRNFGGNIGLGFAPSYRYEPYTTQNRIFGMKDNPFYITATTNVNPPNHLYVGILPYFSGDTITVWQIVAEHSQLLRDGSTDETRLYGIRTYSDTMNYLPYTTIQNKYHKFFVETKKAEIIATDGTKRKLTFAERADSTNKRMIIYLRDEFPFNDANETKGMKNMIAQTRIASSYGYLQALYTTAINPDDYWQYPVGSEFLPENLNTTEVMFPMATRMQRVYLEKGLGNEPANNWAIGFEAALKDYVFKKWNKHKNYPGSVLNNTKKFLPQK